MTTIATHIFRDCLGYTFIVKERKNGTAKWRNTIYKSVEKARRFDPLGHAGFDPVGKINLTL